ncbi:MAG: hypothetical protein ACM32K_01885, partial [Syntrophaceae bacterium]
VISGGPGGNFPGGMGGGTAYLVGGEGHFERRCNKGVVDLEPLEAAEDITLVQDLIRKHAEYTQSTRAAKVLANWDHMLPKFVKVMPRDYKRALNAMKIAQEQGIPWEQAVMVGAHG